MSLIRYASFEVLASAVATQGEPLPDSVLLGPEGGSIHKAAYRHTFDYEPREGYLYVRSRAISSRVNDNWDGFPAQEIKKAWKTFIGKPVFVNHNNSDHRRARGVIIDAALHEDTAPDGSPDTWVEVLMEVDAIRFPKLAEAVVKGAIDRTSMGTDVAYSVCTACGNKASTPMEYCFVPGTLVSLADGSTKSIEDIEHGDVVLTHEGPSAASAVGVRRWSEDIVSLKRVGYSFPVEMTRDHPCYVKRDGAWGRVPAAEVVKGDWIKVAYPDDERDFLIDLLGLAADFVDINGTVILASPTAAGSKRKLSADQAEAIRLRSATESGALLAREYGVSAATVSGILHGSAYGAEVPRVAWVKSGMARFVESSEALSVLLGWYLAEGSVAGFTSQGTPKAVEWALNASEEHVADTLDVALGKYGIQPTLRYRSGQKLIAKVSNAPLATLLCHLGGKTTSLTRAQKKMAPEVILMPRALQRIMLEAYMEGDGWETGVGTKADCRTASAALARQLAVVGSRVFRDIPTVWENKSNHGGPLSREKTSTVYHVTLGDGIGSPRGRRRLDGPYYEAQVSSVDVRSYDGDVYDLTVPGPHTFAVEGMITHNCAHIPRMKGQRITRTTASGDRVSVLVAEMCYGLGFFENSLLVEQPADPTAYVWGVDTRGLAGTALAGVTASAATRLRAEAAAESNDEWDFSDEDVLGAEAFLQAEGFSKEIDEKARKKGHSLRWGHYPWGYGGICTTCGATTEDNEIDEDEPEGTAEGSLHAVEAYLTSLTDTSINAAFAKLAYGETIAPAQVDTLRDEQCPVCGDKDSYSGDACMVCGYVAPPEQFRDPDLEKAKQVDLRGGETEGDAGEKLQCDHCGAQFDATTDTEPSAGKVTPPPATPGTAPSPAPKAPAKPPTMKASSLDDAVSYLQTLAGSPPWLNKSDSSNTTKDGDDKGKLVKNPAQLDDTAEDVDPETEQLAAGSTCPECGIGTLAPVPDDASEQADAEATPVGEPAKDDDDTSTDTPPSGDQDDTDQDGVDKGDVDQDKKTPDDPTKDDSEDDGDKKKKSTPPWFKKKKTSGIVSEASRRDTVDMPNPAQEKRNALIELIRSQQSRISSLESGLSFVAKAAGLEKHPKLAHLVTADAENGDDVDMNSNAEAIAPAAKDDVENVGAAPAAANTGVTPEATTDVQNANVAVDQEPFNKLVDVTQPNTDINPPQGESAHILPTVNNAAPDMKPANTETGWTASLGDPQVRLMASLKLARLQRAAGIETESDLVLAQQLVDNKSKSLDTINAEATVLERVLSVKSSARPVTAAARSLVPQAAAAVQRVVPSMAPTETRTASTSDTASSWDDSI